MTEGRTGTNITITDAQRLLTDVSVNIQNDINGILEIKRILNQMLDNQYTFNQALVKVNAAGAAVGLPLFSANPKATEKALAEITAKTSERNRQLAALNLTLTELHGTPGSSVNELNGLTAQIAVLNRQNELAQEAQKLLITQTMTRGAQAANVDISTLQRALASIQLQLNELTETNKFSKDALKQPDLRVKSDKGPGPAPAA
jgi:hypothetical protein